MPYRGERASKVSHQGIVDNATVAQFHEACEYLRAPSAEEASRIQERFREIGDTSHQPLPDRVIAIDGSWHEGSINEALLPSTRLGYVQIGGVLVDLSRFANLRVRETALVDPFEVARLDENSDRLIFPIPSSNVTYKGQATVRAGFRLAVEESFDADSTWTRPEDPTSSLRSTLFLLAARRTGPLGTGDPNRLLLGRCPNAGCDAVQIPVVNAPGGQACPTCGGPVYATDSLRIWENVTDYQPNGEALGRLMNAVEHLLMLHYIRTLADAGSLESLAKTAFFVDGPLALFGNMAWLHAPILDYLLELNSRLHGHGLDNILLIGLQKTGQISDYAHVIDRHIPANRVLLIDDDFRYSYISPRDQAAVTFGLETHHGQDFLLKSQSGKWFPFALTYPRTKDPRDAFVQAKSDIAQYPDVGRAIKLITELESDLYENASIPIVLAHRYTAISLMPGGRVLDILSRQGLARLERTS